MEISDVLVIEIVHWPRNDTGSELTIPFVQILFGELITAFIKARTVLCRLTLLRWNFPKEFEPTENSHSTKKASMRGSILLLALLSIVHGFPSGTAMFEISTRPWLYYLSGKYGTNITTLSDIPSSELQDIANNGFNYVWFMGVWELVDR